MAPRMAASRKERSSRISLSTNSSLRTSKGLLEDGGADGELGGLALLVPRLLAVGLSLIAGGRLGAGRGGLHDADLVVAREVADGEAEPEHKKKSGNGEQHERDGADGARAPRLGCGRFWSHLHQGSPGGRFGPRWSVGAGIAGGNARLPQRLTVGRRREKADAAFADALHGGAALGTPAEDGIAGAVAEGGGAASR